MHSMQNTFRNQKGMKMNIIVHIEEFESVTICLLLYIGFEQYNNFEVTICGLYVQSLYAKLCEVSFFFMFF